jgi:hypothetical protein
MIRARAITTNTDAMKQARVIYLFAGSELRGVISVRSRGAGDRVGSHASTLFATQPPEDDVVPSGGKKWLNSPLIV